MIWCRQHVDGPRCRERGRFPWWSNPDAGEAPAAGEMSSASGRTLRRARMLQLRNAFEPPHTGRILPILRAHDSSPSSLPDFFTEFTHLLSPSRSLAPSPPPSTSCQEAALTHLLHTSAFPKFPPPWYPVPRASPTMSSTRASCAPLSSGKLHQSFLALCCRGLCQDLTIDTMQESLAQPCARAQRR